MPTPTTTTRRNKVRNPRLFSGTPEEEEYDDDDWDGGS